MNHVPDAAVDAIDEFGKSRLFGNPKQVNEQLRDDLSIRIRLIKNMSTPMDNMSVDMNEESRHKQTHWSQKSNDYSVHCRYETVHTHAPQTLRDRGSFMTTIVDAIDSRLQSWGIDSPEAYTHTHTVDGTHWYEGQLEPR